MDGILDQQFFGLECSPRMADLGLLQGQTHEHEVGVKSFSYTPYTFWLQLVPLAGHASVKVECDWTSRAW